MEHPDEQRQLQGARALTVGAGTVDPCALRTTAAVAASEGDADVPCGTCTACCRSSSFVHVAPEDVAAAALHAHELFLDDAVPGDHELASAPLFDRSDQT